MEDNQKLSILRNVERIYEKAKDSKLEPDVLFELDNSLSILSAYFQITKSQALIAGIIFSMTCHGRTADLEDLIRHLDCTSLKILEYLDDIEYLYSRGLIYKRKSNYRLAKTNFDAEFGINPDIVENVLKGNPVPDGTQERFQDILVFLEKIEAMLEQRSEGFIRTISMFGTLKMMIDSNSDLMLIKEVKKLRLLFSDGVIFLYLTWKTIAGKNTFDLEQLTEMVFDSAVKRVTFAQSIINKTNTLINNSLVEICKSSFFNDTSLQLTDKSLKLLKKCGLMTFVTNHNPENVLKPGDIIHKKLIFDPHEMRQYDLVRNLLKVNNFKKTQRRLVAKSLPKGITVLFHGYPGTGKTEGVLQLARETNRMIMRVDISQSKSVWFGESEKIIKKIFTDYNEFMESCDHTPILFLNEADAIISKRKQSASSNVRQTENTMQNIMLEGMENFQGILLATTNLVNNFDAAFERRFLFKVEFRKPSVTVKAKIWKLKMPLLSVKDCELLASRFDFSGGQIDNITRKAEIHEIIQGLAADLKRIIDFCKEETWEVERIKIGYLKN